MHRKTSWVPVIVCVSLLAGCTSIRVTGNVTDARTGDLIGPCGVTFGSFYSSCDGAGRFVIKGRKYWKSMRVVSPGYVAQDVPVDASKTRTPFINVQMTRSRSTEQSREQAAAPAPKPREPAAAAAEKSRDAAAPAGK